MFELITQNEANRIKQILNETRLKEDINIAVLNGKYKINAFDITESCKTEHHKYDMNEFYLIDYEASSSRIWSLVAQSLAALALALSCSNKSMACP